MHTLGIAIDEIGPGWIELTFTHQQQFTQQHGFTHAGMIATALDSACGYAALSLMPADMAVLTVEYKVNLLRPARADRYRVSATVTKPGRTLTVAQGVASPFDMSGSDAGEPIAIMTATMIGLADAGFQD